MELCAIILSMILLASLWWCLRCVLLYSRGPAAIVTSSVSGLRRRSHGRGPGYGSWARILIVLCFIVLSVHSTKSGRFQVVSFFVILIELLD